MSDIRTLIKEMQEKVLLDNRNLVMKEQIEIARNTKERQMRNQIYKMLNAIMEEIDGNEEHHIDWRV